VQSGYPRLIERFPGSSDEFLRRRFQDSLLDELCRDYDRVIEALESQKSKSHTSAPSNPGRRELQALARKLELEFLERLANHAAREQRDNE